jgi:glycosyltransferase involved in cell wall biosynthesis
MRTTGVTRSKEFSINLKKIGWQPVVVSVNKSKDPWTSDFNETIPEGIDIHRAMEINVPGMVLLLDGIRETILKALKRKYRVNLFHDWLCVPDHTIGWLPYLKGISLARKSRCIYVSCSPFSAAIMATIIGMAAKKPVILDFRDAWTLNPYMSHSWLHVRLSKLLEKWVIARAEKVILNTPGTTSLYLRYYPHFADKFTCIPNGFDPLPESKAPDKKNFFRIVHVGHFYGSRQPDKLLEALADIANPNIQFIQIGKSFPSLAQYENLVNIKIIPPIPRNEALKLMQSADLLYLKQGATPNVRHNIAIAAKTYEYLATGIPIFAECPPGDNLEIVTKYATHSYLVIDGSVDAIKARILEAYSKADNIQRVPNPKFMNDFNREALAKRLGEIIDEI